MSSEEKKNLDEVVNRLDAIIRILLRQNNIQEMTTADQIMILNSSGLKGSDIAKIMGKTRSYISSVLSTRKKGAKNE